MDNEHKLIVAKNLRAGIELIKEYYREQFRANPLKEQWTYLSVREAFDFEFHAHKRVIEDNFAWKSKQLFSKIAMARHQMNVNRGDYGNSNQDAR